MDFLQKERIISIISCDQQFVRLQLHDKMVMFVLRRPTPEEKVMAAVIYDESKKSAIIDYMLSEDDMLMELDERGIWTLEHETVLIGLQKDIVQIKRGMLDFVFQTDKLEKIRATLRRAERVYTEKFLEKHSHLRETAEAYALTQEQRYIINQITQNVNGHSTWPDEHAFDMCTDTKLVSNLCAFYFQNSHFTEYIIRLIARSDPWRSTWNSVKVVGKLFSGSPTEWTYNQKSLAGWSRSYDVAFEAYERPSQDIIEDDDLLDSWFIRQADSIQTQARKHSVKGPSKRAKGRQELFIPASPEGARKVYELNDPQARRQVRVKQQEIKHKKRVREQDMSDSQTEMRMQLTEMQRQQTRGLRNA